MPAGAPNDDAEHSALRNIAIARHNTGAGGNGAKTQEADFMLHFTRGATFAALLATVAIACVACHKPGPVDGQMVVNIDGDHGNKSFNPGTVSVPMGTVVTWINRDVQGHTVTMPGVFDSGPIPPNGGRWSWVASAAGTFTYHCLIHPGMNGTIVVTVPVPTGY
jgi:plastocyanin